MEAGTHTKFEIACRPVDMEHFKERLINWFGVDSLRIKACSFSPSLTLEIRVPLFLEIQGDLCKPA